jgi:hypothetical protein
MRVLARLGLRAALLAALLAPGTARAGAVVIFPLDGRGVSRSTADQATDMVKRALGSVKGIEVIETAQVEKRLGVHLTEQARACEYDTFCLVEVGEILQSERMLIGHVRHGGKEQKQDELELKLFVLDVAKASVIDVLVWKFPIREGALDEAVRAATRRLFAPTDAKVIFDITPQNAEVSFYGEPINRPKGKPFSYWSGSYDMHVGADGRVPIDQRVVIEQGGPTRISIELQPDLLWVAKPKDGKSANPFSKGSRHEGSGITAEEAGAAKQQEPSLTRSPFANIFAWSISAAGVAGVVVGVLMARSAQNDYNVLSAQERYLPDVTVTAAEAMHSREDERARYSRGAVIGVAGGVAVAAGLAWMFIDAAMHPAPSVELGEDGRARVTLGDWELR